MEHHTTNGKSTIQLTSVGLTHTHPIKLANYRLQHPNLETSSALASWLNPNVL